MSRKTVLLVDGDETLVKLRTLMLRLRGYEVERAANVEQARALLAINTYTAVIIDVRHDPGQALALCEEIKARHPRQKVALVANYTLYLPPLSCPDDVISRQDGPEQFLARVDNLTGASA